MNESIMLRNVSEFFDVEDTYNMVSSYGNPIFTAHAYYPIAVLEFDMDEVVFEDFQPIEKAILKCVEIGISSPIEISSFLGLPERYINTHINDLITKGQIVDGKLSEMGKESLKNNMMTQKLNNSKQRFQVDAILGILLSNEFYQGGSRQLDALETQNRYLHIKHSTEIDIDLLIRQLKGDNLINKYRRKVLNTNVTNINQIDFIKMFYVPVFFIWFSNNNNPVIFFKTYSKDYQVKTDDFHHGFKPLFITSDFDKSNNEFSCVTLSDTRLNSLKPSWQLYANSIIPTKDDIMEYFDGRPFRVIDCSYSSSESGVNVCRVYIGASRGTVTMDDLEILAAAGEEPVPVTTIIKDHKENGNTWNKLISFIPIIKDESLQFACAEIRNLWKNDFRRLIDVVSNGYASDIEISKIIDIIRNSEEDYDE